MSKNNIIYGLTCPDTNEIKYIGKSVSGLKRPKQHTRKADLIAKSHKVNWIKSLLSENKIYGIIVIEDNIPKEELINREVYWIKFYKNAGAKLTNSTEGGEGSTGMKMSEETKKLMSDKKKEWIKNNSLSLEWAQQHEPKKHKEENGTQLKHCVDCNSYKPLSEYHKDKNKWDGLRYICKVCARGRKNKYYSDNITKLTPEQLKQSYENRKEAMSKGAIESYKNNPEIKEKLRIAKSKSILRIGTITRDIKEYSSALEAKKDGFQNSNIGVAIKNKTEYKGYYWRFKK